MRRTSLALLSIWMALPVSAQVYPPMIGGDFRFAFQTQCPTVDPNGVPNEPPGLSVSIEPMAGGAPILCVDTPVCETRYEGTVKITATGQRATFVGYAWTDPGCTGTVSQSSFEAFGSDGVAATYPGMKPKSPRLVD